MKPPWHWCVYAYTKDKRFSGCAWDDVVLQHLLLMLMVNHCEHPYGKKQTNCKKNMQRYKLITIFDISGKREDLGFCYGGWFHHRRHKHLVVHSYWNPNTSTSEEKSGTNKQTPHTFPWVSPAHDRGWTDWFIGVFLLLTIFICFYASPFRHSVNSQMFCWWRQLWLRHFNGRIYFSTRSFWKLYKCKMRLNGITIKQIRFWNGKSSSSSSSNNNQRWKSQ